MKTRRMLLPLIAILFMVMTSAATFATLTTSDLPSWFDAANTKRHFTLPPPLEDKTSGLWDSGFGATLTEAPLEGQPGVIETTLFVENQPDPNKIKLVWLQYEWHQSGSGLIADPMNQNLHGSTGVWTPPEWLIEDLGGGNWRKTITWTIIPQPANETFKWWTGGGFFLTDVKVATICIVPEPSSIIALVGGLGSLLALRRRRA
jgi:hypothetical protein